MGGRVPGAALGTCPRSSPSPPVRNRRPRGSSERGHVVAPGRRHAFRVTCPGLFQVAPSGLQKRGHNVAVSGLPIGSPVSGQPPVAAHPVRTGTRSRAGTALGTCPRSCPASSSSGISWPSVTALLSMKISGGRPGMGLHSGGLTYLLAGMYNESDADWRDAGPVPARFQECLCGICSECWEYGTQNGTYVRSMTLAGPCVWLSHSPRCFGASRDFRPELPAGRPRCVVRSV